MRKVERAVAKPQMLWQGSPSVCRALGWTFATLQCLPTLFSFSLHSLPISQCPTMLKKRQEGKWQLVPLLPGSEGQRRGLSSSPIILQWHTINMCGPCTVRGREVPFKYAIQPARRTKVCRPQRAYLCQPFHPSYSIGIAAYAIV